MYENTVEGNLINVGNYVSGPEAAYAFDLSDILIKSAVFFSKLILQHSECQSIPNRNRKYEIRDEMDAGGVGLLAQGDDCTVEYGLPIV